MEELYEYKNLGVLKNYVGSFSSNVTDNRGGWGYSDKWGYSDNLCLKYYQLTRLK